MNLKICCIKPFCPVEWRFRNGTERDVKPLSFTQHYVTVHNMTDILGRLYLCTAVEEKPASRPQREQKTKVKTKN